MDIPTLPLGRVCTCVSRVLPHNTLETSGELTDPYEEAEWLVSRPDRL